jgi:hypothetical protein
MWDISGTEETSELEQLRCGPRVFRLERPVGEHQRLNRGLSSISMLVSELVVGLQE